MTRRLKPEHIISVIRNFYADITCFKWIRQIADLMRFGPEVGSVESIAAGKRAHK